MKSCQDDPFKEYPNSRDQNGVYDQAMKDKDSSSGNGDVISNTACRNMSHNLAYMYVYIYIYIERERERDISGRSA